jgi:hypothetical protein
LIRIQNKCPVNYLWVGGIILSHVLPSSYECSYQRKAVDGTTGGWFVISVRAWHQDCKDLFLYWSRVYMWSSEGTQRTNIYICGTQFSNKYRYWINIQSTCPSCWPIRVPSTVVTNKGVKQVWKVAIEIRTKQKAPQTIELSSVLYVLLFSYLLFSFTIFFFFCLNFFLDFALLIFFLIKEHTRTNLKKFELNWTKDMAYTNSGLWYKKLAKTCGPWNLMFLIEFCNSKFCEPRFAGMKQI